MGDVLEFIVFIFYIVIIFILPLVSIIEGRGQKPSNINIKNKTDTDDFTEYTDCTNLTDSNEHGCSSNSTNFDEFDDLIDKLILKKISEAYYQLEETIVINTAYSIDANHIIKLMSKKKIIQGNNRINCEVVKNNSSSLNEKYTITITINYTQGFKILMAITNTYLENKLNSNDIKVLNEIKRVYNSIIKKDMSPFQKEKTIHDYLIRTSMYDENGYNKNDISQISHTPYGLLFNHLCVCDAYAETFQIFMYLCGIESYVVIGNLIENKNKNYNHAWNIVKLGNKYYHVDVTADNPGPMRFGQVYYTYFNKSDSQMDNTHTWKLNDYPFCDD